MVVAFIVGALWVPIVINMVVLASGKDILSFDQLLCWLGCLTHPDLISSP